MPSKLECLLAVFFLSAGAAQGALPSTADQIVDYKISVKLNPKDKKLDGIERLIWRNTSPDTIHELRFHLYLNAFKNSKSTFYRESGGQLRADKMEDDSWGYIDVTSMKTTDGADLTKVIRYEAPDDGNKNDQTVISVVLPKPVAPGQTITLDIGFAAQLPQVFARTGYKNDFFMVGQWFPKIGVYEAAGVHGRKDGGWNCHQFHANSEFYADFGRYEVDMTVPESYVLGATGQRIATRKNKDATVTYTHVQDNVHDFAWTASPHYIEQRQTFSATKDVSVQEYQKVAQLVGRSVDDVKLSDVEVILLIQPPHLPQAKRYFESAKLAIKWFGLWYGRYPYKTLTLVDPAPGGLGAGGMEYPTLITGGTSFFVNTWPLNGLRELEGVTVHEFGHQFWYAMVASNEFEEAWLDEGFNSYSTAKVMEVGYGRVGTLVDTLGVQVGNEMASFGNSLARRYHRVRQSAWSYLAGNYPFYSYYKPQMLLATLENFLGETTMARVMRAYHERFRFKHPSSDDFYAVANEVSGQDLRWFFNQAVEGTGALDYEVYSATSERLKAGRGYLEKAKGGRVLVDETTAAEKDEATEKKPGQYETKVVVRRRGDFIFPVKIAFKFENKAVETVEWDGREPWKSFEFVRGEKLEWAKVDPDYKIPLDANWLNNQRRVEADYRVPAVATLNWLTFAQLILTWMGW